MPYEWANAGKGRQPKHAHPSEPSHHLLEISMLACMLSAYTVDLSGVNGLCSPTRNGHHSSSSAVPIAELDGYDCKPFHPSQAMQ